MHLQLGMFGYEHIYLALAKKFSTKVHIAPWRMRAYHNLPAMVDCLTTDGETTRIHACNFRVSNTLTHTQLKEVEHLWYGLSYFISLL